MHVNLITRKGFGLKIIILLSSPQLELEKKLEFRELGVQTFDHFQGFTLKMTTPVLVETL